jgi:hypothetical protein
VSLLRLSARIATLEATTDEDVAALGAADKRAPHLCRGPTLAASAPHADPATSAPGLARVHAGFACCEAVLQGDVRRLAHTLSVVDRRVAELKDTAR